MIKRSDGELKDQLRFLVVSTLCVFVLAYLMSFGSANTTISGTDSNLTIWDQTDTQQRYSSCMLYCAQKSKSISNWNAFFYANYSNGTGLIFNQTCSIRFNITGAWENWVNMTFNDTSKRYEYNKTFNYKGQQRFEVNCTSSNDDLAVNETYSIENTAPYVIKDPSGYIDWEGDGTGEYWSCQEDTLCTYNFSGNVSEDDYNDFVYLNYSWIMSANTTLTNFTLNNITGILQINVTNTVNTGQKQIELGVRDSESSLITSFLRVNVSSVNDRPYWINLENFSTNMSFRFDKIIMAGDEENNTPFNFNVTFLQCYPAPWSTRNSSNCTLFNYSVYNATSVNVSFHPLKNDVGNYIINFTVKDLENYVDPKNASYSKIINFTVENVNDAPYFVSICNVTRVTSEDSEFSCWINATDVDEVFNLTFFANYSWFLSNTTVDVTNFSAGVQVNFTARDAQVGNWSINISAKDTNRPSKSNSSDIWLYVNNVVDTVNLEAVENITAYKGVFYSVSVNATDDDLLVQQKNIYNENLNFTANVSWISFNDQGTTGNKTSKFMQFTINDDRVGIHYINLTVYDIAGNSAFRIFRIDAQNNSAPSWNSSLNRSYNLTENVSVYMNLSQYAYDTDADNLTFSYINTSYFPGFSVSSIGIINFTPADADVGFHPVRVNVSDSKSQTEVMLNFTVNNTPDYPWIINLNNFTTSEDNLTVFYVTVYDDDFNVRQKSYYNESLNYSTSLVGINTSLFNLTYMNQSLNYTTYMVNFTPRKADVGSYNVTFNFSDAVNLSNFSIFILTINAINHAPTIDNITLQETGINETFFLQPNATDLEDGYWSGGNLSFNVSFLNGTKFFNVSATYGTINFTLNESYAGAYRLNLSVRDIQNLTNTTSFWLYVYNTPYSTPISHAAWSLINVSENSSFTIISSSNHSIGNNLTYLWYIDSRIVDNVSGVGNGLPNQQSWTYRTNFTDETCSGNKNLTLRVMNPKFNNYTTWNLSVYHNNSPTTLLTDISSINVSGTSVTVNLESSFYDVDYYDTCKNWSYNISYQLLDNNMTVLNNSQGTVTVTFSGWNATFTTTSTVKEYYRITINDSQYSATSNNFSVNFEVSTQTIQVPSSGSSTTKTVKKPVLLKILLPEPVSLYKKDKIELPISVLNSGENDLEGINLTSFVIREKEGYTFIKSKLSKTYIDKLLIGEGENLTLTIESGNETQLGTYEIMVNATVSSPSYSDWAKMYIEIKETNKTEIEKLLIFTDKLLVENPECAELQEVLNEAKRLYEQKRYDEAMAKTRSAIDSCKYSISQRGEKSFAIQDEDKTKLVYAIIIASVVLFFVGIIYYFLKKMAFRNKT